MIMKIGECPVQVDWEDNETVEALKKKEEMRKKIIDYIKKEYKAEPEHLWRSYPDYIVFRHSDNSKWFGIIMDVSRDKLGLDGDGRVDILDVKVEDPFLRDTLIQQPGYLPAYHMNKGKWITVLLDGTVSFEEICLMVDEGYMVTASKAKKEKIRPPKEWIIPANPKYYDIENAFDDANEIDWKQGAGIKLLKRYKPEKFTFEVLKDEYGIYTIRGPRGIPNSLSAALNK